MAISMLQGMDWLRPQRFAAPLAIGAAAVLLVVSEFGFHSTAQALAERERMLSRRVEVTRLQRLVLGAESSQRGYLLTGRPAYKQPLVEALPQIEQQLTNVEALYAGDPAITADVRKLSELVRRRITEINTTVAMFEAG